MELGKVCRICQIHKTCSEFVKISSTSNKYKNICKECKKLQSREYFQKNKIKIKEKRKTYYEQNKDKVLQKVADYYEENRSKIIERSKNRKILNPEAVKIERKRYVNNNKKKVKEINERYRKNNRDKILLRRKTYSLENREKILEARRKYYVENKATCLAGVIKRDMQKKKAIPPWADLNSIKILYLKAKQITETTGIKHVVDHIIPLRGKTVCGLHVHTNLRVISWEENASKSNKFIEELL